MKTDNIIAEKKSRIETLDWLRGLMALSIMFYHLSLWHYKPLDASSPLGRLGAYGVSIFFVLSGLSMAIVYHRYLKDFKTSVSFYIRRIFRIWPLLWVACILTVLPQIIKTGTYSIQSLFLNFTTLFGFIKPTDYIATGAWSIGNEMVYYALTPFIFFLYNYKRWTGNLVLVITVAAGLCFSSFLMHPEINLDKQWALYVNPFNNLFLYVMGIAIYYNFKDVHINTTVNLALLFIASALFCLAPFEGNQIVIVTGIGRIFFVVVSFFLVLCFYKLRIRLPSWIENSLESFGIATYAVYLIHPILNGYLSRLLNLVSIHNSFLSIGIISLITILISIVSYKYFELRFIRMGKQISNRITGSA